MFSRIARLMKGFLGLFVSGLEAANPEALIEAARHEFREKIAQYNLSVPIPNDLMEDVAKQIKSHLSKSPAGR